MAKYERILRDYPELVWAERLDLAHECYVIDFIDKYKNIAVVTFPKSASEDFILEKMREMDTRRVAPTTTAYFDKLYKEQMYNQKVNRERVCEATHERVAEDSWWRQPVSAEIIKNG